MTVLGIYYSRGVVQTSRVTVCRLRAPCRSGSASRARDMTPATIADIGDFTKAYNRLVKQDAEKQALIDQKKAYADRRLPLWQT